MPPADVPKGSTADWLRHARSDLALAKSAADNDVLLESLCFHAEQSVEKEYAVSGRYPGEAEDVTWHELATAVNIAEGVLRWASRITLE